MMRQVPVPEEAAPQIDGFFTLMEDEITLVREEAAAAAAGDEAAAAAAGSQRVGATHHKDTDAFHIGYGLWACSLSLPA